MEKLHDTVHGTVSAGKGISQSKFKGENSVVSSLATLSVNIIVKKCEGLDDVKEWDSALYSSHRFMNV
jgi:hypothetical protein